MYDKNSLRLKAKSIRKTLDMLSISKCLIEKIRTNSLYKKANNIMIYYPTKSEVNLLELLSDNKTFYLPKVHDDKLLVCPYKTNSELEISSLHIMEPTSQPVNPDILDLIIVPALMADNFGFRLGYGGGFYDRFLKSLGNNVHSIVAIPKELFVDKLPFENFDIPVDEVIQA